jgi:hypothetical protein
LSGDDVANGIDSRLFGEVAENLTTERELLRRDARVENGIGRLPERLDLREQLELVGRREDAVQFVFELILHIIIPVFKDSKTTLTTGFGLPFGFFSVENLLDSGAVLDPFARILRRRCGGNRLPDPVAAEANVEEVDLLS